MLALSLVPAVADDNQDPISEPTVLSTSSGQEADQSQSGGSETETPGPETSEPGVDRPDDSRPPSDEGSGGGVPSTLDEPESAMPLEAAQSEVGLVERAAIGPLAATDTTTTCFYGNTGGGQFKDTLCWFDLTYQEGATRKQISTEWVPVGNAVYSNISRQDFSDATTCPNRAGGSGSTYRRATVEYQSVLGRAYGTQTFIGCGRGNSSSAQTNALNGAQAGRDAFLYGSGGKFYGNVTNYPLEVVVPNSDYVVSALMDITAATDTAAQVAAAVRFPTWSGAFLGNRGFYSGANGVNYPSPGIPFFPALYQQAAANGGVTTVTLKNVNLLQGGVPVANYSIVMADSESTDQNESVTFRHSGGQRLEWLPNTPSAFAEVPAASNATNNQRRKNAAVGPGGVGVMGSNTCNSQYNTSASGSLSNASAYGNYLTQWSSIVAPNPTVCEGAAFDTGNKTGTPMVQAIAPSTPGANWTVTQEMKGGGLQAVAFGVLMARTSLSVTVVDRVVDSSGGVSNGSFKADLMPFGPNAPISVETGPTSNTATESILVPVTGSGSQINFGNVKVDQFADSYNQAWKCTKTGLDSADYWPSSTTTSPTPPPTNDSWFVLHAGEFISCEVTFTPPYLTLLRSVDQGGTGAENTADQWNLGATGTAAGMSQVNVTGAATVAEAKKIPVAVTPTDSSYSLTEDGVFGDPPKEPWSYGYDWTGLECRPRAGGSLPAGTLDVTTKKQGPRAVVEAANLKVSRGQDVVCTYTNTAREPQLSVAKLAEPQSGTTVGENQEITYTLLFDNSEGTAPIPVNHVDYLADVLDDAIYQAGSLVCANSEAGPFAPCPTGFVTETDMGGDNPRLVLAGEVPLAESRVVQFKVTTKANADGSKAREAEVAPLKGYALRNFLTPADQARPESCEADSTTCTEHPILAWKLTKSSQPLDGAALHVGGDLHYRMRVERINKEAQGDINGITVSDDLTQTFRFARWFPSAPVPAPAKQRGIYFYQADGSPFDLDPTAPEGGQNRLPARSPGGGGQGATAEDIVAANEWIPAPTFTPNPAAGPCVGPGSNEGTIPGAQNPDCFMGTWTLRTKEFTLPAGAAYADVWFSVRMGFDNKPSGGSDPSDIVWLDASSASSQLSLPTGDWQSYWQPYRQASTGQPFYNVASVASTGATSDGNPIEIGDSLSCSTPEMMTASTPAYNPAGQTLYPQWIGCNPDTFGPSEAKYPTRPSCAGPRDRLPNPDQPFSPLGDPANGVPASQGVTKACVVSQKVDANYFVIRKDLLFRSESGKVDRAINMVGHELKLTMLVPTSTTNPAPIQQQPVPIENVCRKQTSGPDATEITYDYSISSAPLTCDTAGGFEPMMCSDWDDPLGGSDVGAVQSCARFRPIANGDQAGRYRADRLPAAQYWLSETRAPDGRRVAAGQYLGGGVWSDQGVEPMAGAQLLPGSVHLEVTEPLGKLKVFQPNGGGAFEAPCEIPFNGQVSDLPTACINPTGFVMVLTDIEARKLPFAGGMNLGQLLAVVGGAGLVLAVSGALIWRRRLATLPGQEEADET